MSKATLTVEGYLAGDPKIGATQSGDSFLGFSVPHTPRRKNRDTGEWEDAGDTLWVQVTLWREDADRFAPHLTKGTQVRVEGEPVLRAWESNGKSGVNLELKFPRASIIPEKRGTTFGTTDAWAAPDVPAWGTAGDEATGEEPF